MRELREPEKDREEESCLEERGRAWVWEYAGHCPQSQRAPCGPSRGREGAQSCVQPVR